MKRQKVLVLVLVLAALLAVQGKSLVRALQINMQRAQVQNVAKEPQPGDDKGGHGGDDQVKV